MIILGVDTSTDSLMVSLINENKILAEYSSIGTLKHSALLLTAIDKVVKKIRKKIADIDLFSVGLGPGSFTGLRVGITAIRAMAIALNKPIVGVPTMDAIARNGLSHIKKAKLDGKCAKICPLLDAKKNQVYTCIYKYDSVSILRETEYLLEPIEKLMKRLKGQILFLGDAMPLYREQLAGDKSFRAIYLDDRKWLPKASVIAKMGLKAFEGGRRDNPYDLLPMYLYARDCNVRRS